MMLLGAVLWNILRLNDDEYYYWAYRFAVVLHFVGVYLIYRLLHLPLRTCVDSADDDDR